MRVSKFTAPSPSDIFSPPGLHWSGIQLGDRSVSLMMHQSRANPFRRSQWIFISVANAFTCPVCTGVWQLCLHLVDLVHFSRVVAFPFSRGQVTKYGHCCIAPAHCHLATPVMVLEWVQLRQQRLLDCPHVDQGPWLLGRGNTCEAGVQCPHFSLRSVSSMLAHTGAGSQSTWNPDSCVMWVMIILHTSPYLYLHTLMGQFNPLLANIILLYCCGS